MKEILILAGALVALKLLQPLITLIVASLFGGLVGREALAQQPDTIRLAKAEPDVWKDRAAVAAIAGGFRPCGFQDAGTYTVAEMPGVVVRLLANEQDAFYAAIYEHPQAGVWCDVVCTYAHGDSVTYTTSKPTGLEARPGHAMVHLPGRSPMDVYTHACANRAPGVYAPCRADRAVADFERAYAESMAWRKQRGISTREVAEVARKAA